VVSTLAVILAIGILSRGWRGAVIAMAANVVPVTAALALFGLFRLQASVLSSAVLVICLGLVVDDTLHALFRLVRTGGSLDELPYSIAVTSLVLSVGFGAFVMSSFTPVRVLGTVLAAVLATALLADLTIIPWLYRRLHSGETSA
jgi:predicted RND superfamily exporter protein